MLQSWHAETTGGIGAEDADGSREWASQELRARPLWHAAGAGFAHFPCVMRHTYRYRCVTTHVTLCIIHVWSDSSMCRDASIRDVTHSCVMSLIHMRCDSSLCVGTHWYVTWRIYMSRHAFICDVTHSYVSWRIYLWCHTFNVTWRIRMSRDVCTCHVTHSYVTWHFHMSRHAFIRDVTHLYATWRMQLCRDLDAQQVRAVWHVQGAMHYVYIHVYNVHTVQWL